MMPRPTSKTNETGSCLTWGVGGMWMLVFVLLTGLTLAILLGIVEIPAYAHPQPAPLNPPAPAELLPTAVLPAPAEPLAEPPAAAPTPPPPLPSPTAQPEAQNFTLIEPTFTPLVPVTPTATPFITPPSPFGGPIVIGHSVEGRPLEVYRFGYGPVQRLIVAGIHGGYEWNTVDLADELIAYLQARPDRVPPGVTLYILRVLNPDGLARSKGIYGRANAHNVDINRNFPTHWAEKWAAHGCWSYLPITAGPRPRSEPETAAVMDFILDYRIGAVISYHSAALGIFAGGDPSSPASLSLAEAVAAVSSYPYPHVETDCNATGQFADWTAANGLAALDIELHNHKDSDFEENLPILDAFLNWRMDE